MADPEQFDVDRLTGRVGNLPVDKEVVMLPGGHVSLAARPSAVKRMWPNWINGWRVDQYEQ